MYQWYTVGNNSYKFTALKIFLYCISTSEKASEKKKKQFDWSLFCISNWFQDVEKFTPGHEHEGGKLMWIYPCVDQKEMTDIWF